MVFLCHFTLVHDFSFSYPFYQMHRYRHFFNVTRNGRPLRRLVAHIYILVHDFLFHLELFLYIYYQMHRYVDIISFYRTTYLRSLHSSHIWRPFSGYIFQHIPIGEYRNGPLPTQCILQIVMDYKHLTMVDV